MTNEMVLLLMAGTFLGLSFLGTPVAFSLLAGALVGTIFTDVSYGTIVGHMFNGVNSVPLLAVPFFLLVAELMDSAGIATRIIYFVQTLVGHIRSGLAQVNAVFSIFFAGISGSSMSDVAANSRVLLPAMKREGYDPASSAALIAAASTIANLIPPSVMAVVYGATGGVSIAALFLGGVIPGVLVGLGLMIYSYFFVHSGTPRPRAPFDQMVRAGAGSLLPLMIPVIIMGGILGGFFTPTEAGMVAVVYIIVVVIPALARGHLRKLFRDFIHGGVLYSLPMIAVAGASVFAWLFTFLGGASAVADLMSRTAGDNPVTIMFAVVLMLVIVGQFIDAIPAIVVFTPIIVSLIELGDVNPVHMGVVVIVTLALGLITPPYGLSLLLATSFAKVPFLAGVRKALPLYGLFAGIITLLILSPETALWLPRLVVPRATGCFPAPGGEGFICP
jgi:C4-dicarboxylate transporter DctM subunit